MAERQITPFVGGCANRAQKGGGRPMRMSPATDRRRAADDGGDIPAVGHLRHGRRLVLIGVLLVLCRCRTRWRCMR